MPLEIFKNIEDRIGYVVNENDRDIFQKSLRSSYFGQGSFDFIEFIVYDSNDNQLPQASVDGRLVRYLYRDDPNTNKYFLIPNKEQNSVFGEYVIDLESLVREAGYSNGIFKTRVTLLNRRIGSWNGKNDKLWIHEISPSRTEIRVLPVRNPETIPDLENRYSIVTEGGNFKDDTVYFIKAFIDNLNIQNAIEHLINNKGGEKYLEQIKNEFDIQDIDEFLLKIRDGVWEGVNNYYNGLGYIITQGDTYGNPIDNFDNVGLSIEQIVKVVENILVAVIDYYLIVRPNVDSAILDFTTLETIDKLKEILVNNTSNKIFNTRIEGCTNPSAINYNPSATISANDGCIFDESLPGCTDISAINYNPLATEDDGSCKYGASLITKTWYVWSNSGIIIYKNKKGFTQKIEGKLGESFELSYIPPIKIYGDIRETPKPEVPESKVKKYKITNSFVKWFSNSSIESEKVVSFTYTTPTGTFKNVKLKLNESVDICADIQTIKIDESRLTIKEIGDC